MSRHGWLSVLGVKLWVVVAKLWLVVGGGNKIMAGCGWLWMVA